MSESPPRICFIRRPGKPESESTARISTLDRLVVRSPKNATAKFFKNGDAERKSLSPSASACFVCVAWSMDHELVKPEHLIVLKTVAGLKQGRLRAVESEPVGPVSLAHVDTSKEYLRPVVWGMIQLQRLTGMRPGEVRMMRLADIDRSATVTTIS